MLIRSPFVIFSGVYCFHFYVNWHRFDQEKDISSSMYSPLSERNGLPRIGPFFRPTLIRPILFIRIRPVRK